jgi:hypothetical protein
MRAGARKFEMFTLNFLERQSKGNEQNLCKGCSPIKIIITTNLYNLGLWEHYETDISNNRELHVTK